MGKKYGNVYKFRRISKKKARSNDLKDEVQSQIREITIAFFVKNDYDFLFFFTNPTKFIYVSELISYPVYKLTTQIFLLPLTTLSKYEILLILS